MSWAANIRSSRWLIATIVIVGLKLWLVAAQPVIAHGDAAWDDRLFLELANNLLSGKWLGPYSQFTLMKGPMYSFFIAGVFWLGLPLPMAQHLLYLLGCALLVLALRPSLSAAWQSFALFTLLWWQPMSFVELDLLRQNLYTPLTLLLFAALVALNTYRDAKLSVRLVWGILLGISFAAFWLTREEGLWVLPGIGLLIGATVWNSWRRGERVRPLILPLSSAVGCAGAILFSVCELNYVYYGWFGTVEFRAPQFLAAYGALQRPISEETIPYLTVSKETRRKLYQVSPAFSELQPWLEGSIGKRWAQYATVASGRPAEEHEIAGGWFMWALRDAVAAARHPQSAREALDFYGRIASEVNRACDSGLLGAVRKRRDSMIPPWLDQNTKRLREDASEYVAFFFLFRHGYAHFHSTRQDFTSDSPLESDGPPEFLMIFRDLTRWSLAPSADAPELALPQQTHIDQWRLAVLRAIGWLFRWICIAIVISGCAAWLFVAVRFVLRGKQTYLFVVTTAALGSACGVMLVNLLVHVLSFPNENPSALHEGYPLLILFGVTSWFLAMASLTGGDKIAPAAQVSAEKPSRS